MRMSSAKGLTVQPMVAELLQQNTSCQRAWDPSGPLHEAGKAQVFQCERSYPNLFRALPKPASKRAWVGLPAHIGDLITI